jgi:aminopeptidase N
MTEKTNSLLLINKYQIGPVSELNQRFLADNHTTPSLKEYWFFVQTQVQDEDFDLMSLVQKLILNPYFAWTDPNVVRSLIGGWMNNFPLFHSAHSTQRTGEIYHLSVEIMARLDQLNPQLAASLAKLYPSLGRMPQQNRQLLRKSLFDLLQRPSISKDVHEIIEKSLLRHDKNEERTN